jgi:hypothetical protein
LTVLPLADAVASELLVRWIDSRHQTQAKNALVRSNLTLGIINDIAACWPPLPTVAYRDAWKSFASIQNKYTWKEVSSETNPMVEANACLTEGGICQPEMTQQQSYMPFLSQ